MIKLVLIFLILVSTVRAQTEEEYKHFIWKWEGYRHISYKDSDKVAAGLGHYIPNGKVGVKYSDEQIETWFHDDLLNAKLTAISSIKGFISLPTDVKLVVIGVIWTVGNTGFKRFSGLRKSLEKQDYWGAAECLRGSLWYKQVGETRALNHVNTLKNITTK